MPQELLDQIDVLHTQYAALTIQGKLSSFQQRNRTHYTYTSNAIEGNTLTEMETALVINDGVSIGGKKIVEIQEAINHSKAIDLIDSRSVRDYRTFGIKELCEIHAVILRMINDDYAGVWRDVPVRIQGSRAVLPNYAKVPDLMKQWEESLRDETNDIVLQAIRCHYDIVTIHPFVDGNGRTARLFMNAVLCTGGYPLISIEPSDRQSYVESLEQAQTGGSYEEYEHMMLGAIIKTFETLFKGM